ncbi:23S rRNA (adenine(2503)-C(2))-methyltransferase RlmN [Candidatus Falkowbacteria bacterium]|uniref:Probable dual-specificity RNA methyltransferase RlmN n=1 Tax=Candidatus Buchananbacteria bacterium CG10_big_fil_rev_8_21_14_0_10_33_19 TaxID=1974525 RepID=A0A2H0W3P2_9BACT|nr:23S rRNA (adenine(2503)-C(2))-methyltransferase RlmN [Candidatus Falkowbacteria bacterium]PIS05983.1 MAG: 23S rRNA (adenine(2503)-C(2))-methyltransferase RlmN [Candidatus Buchananbacteria bacterium CG10_big_fil_rev_8_21_14_0_10_33_19]
MNIEKISEVLVGQPAFRYKQIQKSIYGDLIDNWDQATTLSKDLRQKLNQECPLEINGEIKKTGDKKTLKAIITLLDNQKIETVLMMHKDGRYTVCVSSQVGCALGCTFCATGEMGYKRNLKTNEIIEQVIFFSRYIRKTYSPEDRVTNIVFMGMGEPMLNYDNVLAAVRILNSEETFNIGARKISISTSGITEGIKKLALEGIQVNLAISLHAPNDKMRLKLMPISRKYKIDKIISTMDSYIEKTGRQVMIEYLLIKDSNDSIEAATELAELLKGKLVVVNLIPCNPVGGNKPSPEYTIKKFKNILLRNGITVTQRYTFGRDIDAACGQLAIK